MERYAAPKGFNENIIASNVLNTCVVFADKISVIRVQIIDLSPRINFYNKIKKN